MQEIDLDRVRHLLPETMVQIVDTVGVKAALDLVKAIGGARFKFGKGKNDTPRLNMLFTAIGEEKTYELLRVFGGEELYVPRCEEALRELRNEQFRHEFFDLTQRQGMSRLMAMSTLCPRYQISDRTGYAIVGSRAQAAAQQNLF